MIIARAGCFCTWVKELPHLLYLERYTYISIRSYTGYTDQPV